MAGTQAEIDALLAEAQTLAATSEAGGDAGPTSPALAAATVVAGAGTLASGGASSGARSAPGGWNRPGNERMGRILQIKVPLMVVLAQRKMPVREILSMCIGSIIEFDKPFDEELELLVNNRSIAFGHAVKIGENFGLRISRIGDVRARIDALRSEVD